MKFCRHYAANNSRICIHEFARSILIGDLKNIQTGFPGLNPIRRMKIL